MNLYLLAALVFASSWGWVRYRRRIMDMLRMTALPFVVAWEVLCGMWAAYKWAKGKWKMWRRRPAFGDSDWASVKQLRKAGNLSGDGFVVGKLKGHTVRTREEYSCLMFGRPGAGKSLTMAATLHAAASDSLVVYDPPKQLWKRFHVELEAKGYKVVKIDLDAPAEGMMYDVCAFLEGATGYQRETRLKQLAGLVTADLHDGGKNSEHFAETAEILIQGVLGWLFENDRPRATFFGVAEILLASSAAKRGAIFKQIAMSGNDVALMAINMWEAAESAKGGEASGFRSSVSRALRPWMATGYRDLTTPGAREAFDWSVLLGAEPVAVFLTGGVLRDEEVKSFVRVFFGQAAGFLAATYANSGPLARRVKLMIDEGVMLGRCLPVFSAIEQMRKVGVAVFVGYQSAGQVRDIWGGKASVMVDCCDIIVSGGSKTPKDYLDISQLIGSRTVKTISKNASGISEGEAGRHLQSIEDMFRLPDDEVVALLGSQPALLKKPFKIGRDGVSF